MIEPETSPPLGALSTTRPTVPANCLVGKLHTVLSKAGGNSYSEWWGPATLRLERGSKDLGESLKIKPKNLSLSKCKIHHPDTGHLGW